MASLITTSVFDKDTKVHLPGKEGGVDVPAIALGTWSWGDSQSWDYEKERDLPGIKEVWAVVNQANLGFYDTAEVYGMGESERIIGNLLKDMPAAERSKIIIATKWLPTPILPGRWFPGGIVQACKNSLARLQVESVDLYQVHAAWTYFYSINSIAKGLAECVKLGLVKTVGVSNYSKEKMIEMYEALKKEGVPLASNQVEYSLLRRYPEHQGLLKACHERGIVPLAYSPLSQGRLTGKYSSSNPPPSNRKFGNIPMEKVDKLVDVMRGISEKRNVPISSIALNYVLCKGAIPLGGARNAKQAEQNLKVLNWRLTDEEIAELEEKSEVGGTGMWQKG